MARYFFNTRDGVEFVDNEGTELPDWTAAQMEAARHLADMLQERPDELWRHPNWTVTVKDERGLTLFVIDVNAQLVLDLQSRQAADDPRSWKPLVNVSGGIDEFAALHGDDVSERTVVDFMLFDLRNPSSILSCISFARENARCIRDQLASEVWEQINSFYLKLREDDYTRYAQLGSSDYLARVKTQIQLFYGMQSSLSMVYDREVGSMRVLLTSPFPRWSLLAAKLTASVLVSVLQVYVFLAIAAWWDVDAPVQGYVLALPALVLTGLMLGSIGLFLSSLIRQLENFASVMNFVIFPMFFASSALYPLWRIREASEGLYLTCLANPFTHGVELVRFALYGRLEPVALAVVVGTTVLFFAAALIAYDPSRGLMVRRGGPKGEAS